MTDKTDLSALKIDHEARPTTGRPWLVPALIGAVVLIAGGTALAFWIGSSAPVLETVTVRPAETDSPTVLNASGYVTPRRKATVAAEITGRVTEMLVEEGMKVRKGQVLARLDDAEWRAQLQVSQADREVAARSVAEAEFNLDDAKRTRERTLQLQEDGFVSQQDLDRADTNVGIWQARLMVAREQVRAAERRMEYAQRNLDNCTVLAPFDGIAVSKDAQVGEIVSPMSAGGGFTRTGISTIVDMTSLEIEVDVNESYIARVVPDQPVVATLDAYPDWKIPARVRTTIPTADRQKATVKVRIAFDQLDPRILPDMGVKVAFLEARSANAEAPRPRGLIAKDAVIERDGTTVAFVVRDGKVERRAIKVTEAAGADVAVLAGLADGDVVVVRPPADLRDGQRIKTAQ